MDGVIIGGSLQILLRKWSAGFIIVFVIFLMPHDSIGCNTDEPACLDKLAWKLDHDLFENYNPLIRPVRNFSESLTVRFTLVLSTIIAVDSKNQFIVTNVWLTMNWYDYQLVWDPADYGMINGTKTSAKHIWVPDIVLFNNADGVYEPSYSPNVLVDHPGKIQYIPPAIYTSSCSIDVEYFPFDQQECLMKFGSWTFLGHTLHYQLDQVMMDTNTYMRNGAWDIISCPGHIEEIKDTITGEPKEIIVFKLIIRRKTLFYTVNLIIPCFLHAFVCLCVFVLPADGCDKMTLTISVLVSLVVFLVLVQKILPPSMKIPLIAKYFLFTFIMNVLEILVTVFVIFANHRSPRSDIMPKWVCWLLLYKLPKYLWMERPDHDERWQQKTCDEPPSYPTTPQVLRALVQMNHPGITNRLMRPGTFLTSPDDSRGRENDRVYNLRKDTLYHGSGSSTQSSMGSESHVSGEDSSAGAEVAESLCADHRGSPLPPFNGHRCMLQDYAMAPPEDTSNDKTRPLSPQTVQPQKEPETDKDKKPYWLTQEMNNGINAVKFIWRQMQNQEEYDTVLDDWKYVGAVLDRLLLIIFIVVTLGGTLGVLINAPHILETVDEEENLKLIRKGIRIYEPDQG